jgi:hypothetical protein
MSEVLCTPGRQATKLVYSTSENDTFHVVRAAFPLPFGLSYETYRTSENLISPGDTCAGSGLKNPAFSDGSWQHQGADVAEVFSARGF